MSRKKSGGILTGILIGVGLGVLFAPKKGSETRAELGEKINELWEKLKELEYNEVKTTIETKLKELQKELSTMDKEKFGKICRDQATIVKNKAEEIYELAKEKGTPVLQKTAKDLLTKSAELLSNAADKIEEPAKTSTKKPASKKTTKKTTKK